jgi:alcohol dehydrogenase, propanol-preferring
MKALLLNKIDLVENNPLKIADIENPSINQNEILVKISVCGICHTEIDEIEGRRNPKLPIVLGHEIIGNVVEKGDKVSKFQINDRVGISWIYSSCGKCKFCIDGYENLCNQFKATGCDENGGYAELIKIPENSAFLIPDIFKDSEAAPLMCAGAIGYRSLRFTEINNKTKIGLFGFGASAHIVIQIIKYRFPNAKVYVFTRHGQQEHKNLAFSLGADWVGVTGENMSPEKLDCAIDFTPVWTPIIWALENLDKRGKLIINAIRKENTDKDILSKLDYVKHLWLEKEIKSVANVTSKDVEEFLAIASRVQLKPEVKEFKFEEANYALNLLKAGKIKGAGVLRIH